MAKHSPSDEGNEIDLQTENLETTLQKLQDLKTGETPSGDIMKLKRLVLIFKKKYKQALEELSQKERSQSANVKETDGKLQEAIEDNAALIEQQAHLKNLLLKEKEQTLELSRRIEQKEQENDELKRLGALSGSNTLEGDGSKQEIERLKQKLTEAEELSYQLEKQKRRYEEVLRDRTYSEEGVAAAAIEERWKKEFESLKEKSFLLEKEYKEKLWLQKEELQLAKQEAALLKEKSRPSEKSQNLSHPEVERKLAASRQEKEAVELQKLHLKEEISLLQEELLAVKAELTHAKLHAIGAKESDVPIRNLNSLKEEIRAQRLRIEQLMKVISERERRISELQKYEFSFKKVTEINQQYEKEAASLKVSLSEMKEQKDSLEKESNEAHVHSRQLTLAVDHLRGKCEELKLDCKTFQTEFEKAEAQVFEMKEEASLLKEKQEELKKALVSSEAAAQENLTELKLTTSELERIQRDCQYLETQVKRQADSLMEVSQKLQKAEDEKQQLKNELSQTQAVSTSLQKELEMMKQTLVKGLKEARDIKQYYQSLANEKSAVLQKTTLMQQHIRELTEELKGRDRSLEDLQKQLEESREELHNADLKIAREKERNKEQIHEIELRDESLASFAEQIKTMQAKLKAVEDGSKEKESSAVEAKQQFAKKAREAQLLSDANVEMKLSLSKHQEALIERQAKINEAQATLEAAKEQIKKLQDQIGQMEKKYFKAHERLQEVEAQNKELKKVEQKHAQMQQLLANISSVVGSPIGLTQPYGLMPESVKPGIAPAADLGRKPDFKEYEEPESRKEKKASPAFDDQSLFDPKQPPSKLKKDLFEQ